VTSEDLRKWNGLKAAKVTRGMVLRVYTVGGTPEVRPAHSAPHASTKKKSTAAKTAAPNNNPKKPS